ncbi:KDM4A demethylase, partial [Atractosteus spatula]|nr:KDM4A demethylase [Atractosteus spatula]
MTSDSTTLNPGNRIMTFYPTKEEFGNFSRYIAYIESQGAHKAGLAKIVPPKDWKPRRSYDDIDELVIPAPIQQVVTGQSGLFTQYNIQKKPMTVREFRKIANSDKFCNPRYADFEELERKYWKNLTFNPPIYGADVNGTLYDPDVTEWNIGHLNTILDTVERESGITIEGVNTPYLYFGMWKTTFAWHTEDMDLYSINYLHFGEPKSWYCIPPEHGKRLERLAKGKLIQCLFIWSLCEGFFPGSSQNCEAFLRHKMTLISPSILKKYGIPFEKITQEAGEFMVTFPYGYHAGFNHGFNCAESTNFATHRWIEYGKQAILCSCRKDMVKISMDVFVRKFQPERYRQWKAGKDNAVIDHSKPTPEAAEFLREGKGGFETEVTASPDGSEHVQDAEEEKRSVSKQRIGTKRHRVCLEVPEEVLTKEEFSDAQYEVDVPEKKMKLATELDCQAAVGCREGSSLPEQGSLLILHNGRACCCSARDSRGSVCSVVLNAQVLTAQHWAESCASQKYSWCERPFLHLAFCNKPWYLTSASACEICEAGRKTKATGAVLQVKEGGTRSVLVWVLQSAVTRTRVETGPSGTCPRPLPGSAPPGRRRAGPAQRTLSPAEALQAHSYARGDVNTGTRLDQMSVVVCTAGGNLSWASPMTYNPVKSNTQHTIHQRASRKSDIADMKKHRLKLIIIASGSPWRSCAAAALSAVFNLLCVARPLSKLPRHHPLIRDCFSDEELQEQGPADEETGEAEPWAKPLTHLWQNRPHNLQAEREYNLRMGQQAPYCAVCMLFQTYQQVVAAVLTRVLCVQSECSGAIRSPEKDTEGQLRTKPLIPEMCFTATEDNTEVRFSAPYLEEDGTSLLVSCAQCCVRVHTSCYGVAPEKVTDDWKCSRCEANAEAESCCLCPLRGGALRRANNDKWVHVLCAVAVLEARFVNIAERSPVDLSGIPLQRFKLKCFYCKKRMKKTAGCCVQCSHGRCPTSFHATCAQAAGVLMQPDDWPFVVFITCYRHKGEEGAVSSLFPQRNKAVLRELCVGQKVICKHKNGRYYQCEVVRLTKETFYEVNFDDGSFSDNLFPEDIVSRDCLQLGPPAEGEVVQVRWTDGLVYGARFVAAHVIQMYQVEFEDGSQLTAKRDDVYTLDEELPKRVRSRLSVASDMRFDGIFTEKEVKQESKRQRVINSRYRGDYIEPVVYRAIME